MRYMHSLSTKILILLWDDLFPKGMKVWGVFEITTFRHPRAHKSSS